MSNITNITSSPTSTLNETTLTPTSEPTTSPTTLDNNVTSSPTQEPTKFDTFAPTSSPSMTPPPTDQVEIMKLPNYKSKDPVDGIFIVFAVVILLTLILACFQTFKRNKTYHRDIDKEVENSIREELTSRNYEMSDSLEEHDNRR